MDQKNLHDNTQIYYLSDHGDNIGERGVTFGENQIFTRSLLECHASSKARTYRPEKDLYNPPVSLIDIHPTILQTAGIDLGTKPGASLIEIANADDDPERLVFSEYHAMGSATGAFYAP